MEICAIKRGRGRGGGVQCLGTNANLDFNFFNPSLKHIKCVAEYNANIFNVKKYFTLFLYLLNSMIFIESTTFSIWIVLMGIIHVTNDEPGPALERRNWGLKQQRAWTPCPVPPSHLGQAQCLNPEDHAVKACSVQWYLWSHWMDSWVATDDFVFVSCKHWWFFFSI